MTVAYEWSRRHERRPADDREPPLDIRRHLRVLLERIDVDEVVRRCVVRDALRDALACTWRRRAAELEWARPRPADYPGRAGALELDQRDRVLAETALACRRKAALLEAGWLDGDE